MSFAAAAAQPAPSRAVTTGSKAKVHATQKQHTIKSIHLTPTTHMYTVMRERRRERSTTKFVWNAEKEHET